MNLFRLLSRFIGIGILTEMEYRANFFIQAFQSVLNLATALAGLFIVFNHTDQLSGWSEFELLVLIGIFNIMGGLIHVMIEPGMRRLMEDVRQGTLDYILIKPQDSQLLVSIRQFQVWKVIDVILGIIVLIYAVFHLPGELSWINVMAFMIALSGGFLIVYSFWLILATLSIWFVKVENILFIFQSIYQAGRWPVDIYPRWLKATLTFIVPVAFATSIPAKNLTGQITEIELLFAAAGAGVLFILSRKLWQYALRFYSGASA